MVDIFLALGSNVGDKRANIETAIQFLAESITDIRRAPIYTSKAVGYTDQPDFVNTAIAGKTDLPPDDLLAFVKAIEQKVGRVMRFRWGPREIDIDIIFYGQKVVDGQNLTIPHPRFRERDFVLKPLSNLDPNFVDPVSKLDISELLAKLPPSELAIIS